MAIRRRYANNRKHANALYKRAQQHQALANYFYKLAEDAPAEAQNTNPSNNNAPAAPKGPKLDYLPVIGGAVSGAGIGGASAGGLARLFLGDEEKARKWVLLSALLGAAAGGIVGAYGMSPFMTGSNLEKLLPASEAPAAAAPAAGS